MDSPYFSGEYNEHNPTVTTDSEWQQWGIRDPYFAVLTNPKYRTAAITPEAKSEFFESGIRTVNYVLETCRRHFDTNFRPERVLDFGCGVGRMSIPFAALAREVVALDAAESMLAEARLNCEQRNCHNLILARSDDSLTAAPGQFDLVHSCLVLQHIELDRGRDLFAELVRKVKSGGCGSIQITFACQAFESNFGVAPVLEPIPPASIVKKVKAKVRLQLEEFGLMQSRASNTPDTEIGFADPEMQMNYFNLSQLMFILHRAGVTQVVSDMTNHGGAIGAFLFFKMP